MSIKQKYHCIFHSGVGLFKQHLTKMSASNNFFLGVYYVTYSVTIQSNRTVEGFPA